MSFRNIGLISLINGAVYDLPVPCNLNMWWNFGSLLGITVVVQFATGIVVSFNYVAHPDYAFLSVDHIIRNVNNGWLFRYIHVNGATIFFICMYLHIGRGLYYGLFHKIPVWNTGVILFFLTIIIAFLGYVLPWGQMSFWGATVITSFVTILPEIGNEVAIWIWGGWVVGAPTLTRFYTFHFLFPFVLLVIIISHVLLLHVTGSGNPLGMEVIVEKVPFHPYYTVNDLVGVFLYLTCFIVIVLFYPTFFIEGVNYLEADDMDTPLHIVPEWYFLFAYSILRSVPNNTGGVVLLMFSVFILLLVPFINVSKFISMAYYPFTQFFFWSFFTCFALLGWIGTRPDNHWPIDRIEVLCTGLYFLSYFIIPVVSVRWDSVVVDSSILRVVNNISRP